MNTRRWHAIGAGMMILILLLTGCGAGGKSPSGNTPQTKTITVAQGVDATTMDPHMQSETPTSSILVHIFDTLLERDDEMKLQPSLALSVKSTSDTVWEVELRPNVKFHNGEAMDARSVKYSIDRVIDPAQKSQQLANFNMITKVEIVDNLKLKITTKDPYPILPNRLAALYIMPAEYSKAAGDAKLAKEPVGTGPFKLKQWVKNEQVVLEANKEYWGGAPKVDRVVFRAIPEAATRLAELQTGAVDLIVNLPPDQAQSLGNSSKYKVLSTPSARFIYLTPRTDHPILGNTKVRQAISYAIDRESIVKNILGGYGIPLATPVPQGFFGYEESFKPTPYDPEKAKALLAEAGYPNGFELEMGSPAGRYLMDKEVSEAIIGQLAKVGIRAKMKVGEWGVYAQKIFSKEQAPLFLVGWGNSTFDADGNYYSLLKSGERMTYYNNAKLDDLLVRARGTMDQKLRASLYHDANQHFVDEQPLIVLYQNKDVYGTSSRLVWTPRSDELIMLHQADIQAK